MNYNKTMTKQEMLAEVTAQIRKDIPRLMNPTIGCRLLVNVPNESQKEFRVNANFYHDGVHYLHIVNEEHCLVNKIKINSKNYEIIGHDIMLNDVLEWLKNLGFLIECSGLDFGGDSFYREELVYDDNGNFLYKKTTFCEWNLPSPYLKDQSEELIKFLYDIKTIKI